MPNSNSGVANFQLFILRQVSLFLWVYFFIFKLGIRAPRFLKGSHELIHVNYLLHRNKYLKNNTLLMNLNCCHYYGLELVVSC